MFSVLQFSFLAKKDTPAGHFSAAKLPFIEIHTLCLLPLILPKSSRSHPTTLRIEEQLSKLKAWENSSPSTSKSIRDGLLGLDDLYASMDALLHMASTKQLLSSHQNRKWVDGLVDGFMKLLDICSKTRDLILRKKTKKEALKLMSSAKQTDDRIGSIHGDLHLYAVVRALKESSFVTVSIFGSVLSLMAIESPKSKPSRWQLVSKVVMRRGAVASEENEEMGNEFVDVDAALGAVGDGVEAEKLQSARRSLEGLEIAMEGFENGLKGIFREMIRARACLLNLISH